MMKKSGAIVTLAVLCGAVAFAADGDGKPRFSPKNDDYKASGQRYAQQQGTSPSCCPADLDCNGEINGADLGLLLNDWGVCASDPCLGDINDDGVVNGFDLGTLLSSWGNCTG